MVVLSSLISIPIGVIYGRYFLDVYWVSLGIIRITNPIVSFFLFFASSAIIAFILIFTAGCVLYFPIRWFRGGSTGSQFYFRLTVILSIVSSIIGGFIAAVDVNRITESRYRGYSREQSIKESISEFISKYDVNPGIDSVIVGAMCCAGVWIIYLSILGIYRGLNSDDEE